MKTVIIGGVAGGASCAARLRRLDEHAEIIILERGGFISFANCGLPYYIGGEITDKDELTLQTPESFRARFNVDVRVFSEAVAIDAKAKRVTVKNAIDGSTYEESYDKLVLSMGAEPLMPPIPGAASDKIFTLRNIPDTFAIREYITGSASPKSAAIIGGGYIGMELAENMKAAGLDVTIIELADHVIAPLDRDMAADVHAYIRKKGLHLVLGNGVKAIEEKDGGLVIKLTKGEVAADVAIMSVGVRPESAIAKEAGLAVNERGCILVDGHMLTSDPDIYAVGDATAPADFFSGKNSFVPLAGPANKQGRIAADNICGRDSAYNGTQGSAILKFFDMTVATTGVSERRAKAEGIDYDKVYLFSGSHAGYYPGSTGMSVKVIFEKGSGILLGAQIVGYAGVDKRADVLATAIRLRASAADLTRLELCYAPPFSSAKDPVNMAGYVIENVLNGSVKQFFWHDVAYLPRDGSVQLVDVRTPGETARGMIDGFCAIPLDQLRSRLGELDKAKPVYVHCHSGLRSYIACRILTGAGFDAYNLAGGWRLYSGIMKDMAAGD